MLPPGIKTKFEDNYPWVNASLLAYEQVRQLEDAPKIVSI